MNITIPISWIADGNINGTYDNQRTNKKGVIDIK